MFDSQYDLIKLPHEEAELLLGEQFTIGKVDCLIINLDEYSSLTLGTKYSLIKVCKWESPVGLYPTILSVGIPGIDDFNFKALFKPSADIHLSGLIELAFNWAARSNYRYINCHALEDYCKYLGAYEFDWN